MISKKQKVTTICLLAAGLFVNTAVTAQDQHITTDQQLLRSYLEQTRFPIDTSAKAIVLYEKGDVFIRNGTLERQEERVVKILGSDAVQDFATISIAKGDYSAVTKIKGETYNLRDGVIEKQEIVSDDILKDEIDKHTTVLKFNLPSVKEGSVVRYTFTTVSPGWLFIPGWRFQGEYPALESVYEINVPSYINYIPLERVNVPMAKANRQKELAQAGDASFQETAGNQINHIWVRRNIPAFREEPFMSSSKNFVEGVRIHIESFRGDTYNVGVYSNWTQVSKKFFYENEQQCGQVFAANRFLKDKVEELTTGKKDDLEKAKAIFAYVRDSIREKPEVSGSKTSNLIKDIYNKKEGTGAGMNFLLTAMLRVAGLQSEPVLLATKSNEHLNSIYPDLNNINYIASRVKIGRRNYFLDASVKQMPFGMLLPACYNGYCRVVSEQGEGIYLEPDSLRNKNTLMLTIAPDKTDSGKLRLTVDRQFGQVSGLEHRKEWQRDTGAVRKAVQKELNGGSYPGTLSACVISNLDNPDKPLTLHYEATLNFNPEETTIYFDPYYTRFCDKNPFSATSRKYAIEKDYLEDINYIMRFQLPEGYEIDDYPASSNFQLGENKLVAMKNIFSYDKETRMIMLNSRLTSGTTLISADLYEPLRLFYERVMEEQHKKIVIKKSHI